jgi:hypothetical protein
MEQSMKKERRWLKSVIAAAQTEQVSLPWERGNRRRPTAMPASTRSPMAKPAVAQAIAAR